MSNPPMNQAILNKIRKNKYILVLTLPPILKTLNTNVKRSNELLNLNSLQYSVYGVLVPKISVPSHGLGVMGQTYNVTSQTRSPYQPVSVFFTIDNLLNNYWVLWKWLQVLNDPINSGMDPHFAQFNRFDNIIKTNNIRPMPENADNPSEMKVKVVKMINDYTDYQTIVTVFLKNEYDQNIAKVNYYNSFITDLGEINYSSRDPAEAESYFTFSFNQMDIELLDVGNGQGID